MLKNVEIYSKSDIVKDLSADGTKEVLILSDKSTPNFLWTFAVLYHPPLELYIAPFIIGSKYLSNIFFESLSTARRIDSKPDWDQQSNGKKSEINTLNLKFNCLNFKQIYAEKNLISYRL